MTTFPSIHGLSIARTPAGSRPRSKPLATPAAGLISALLGLHPEAGLAELFLVRDHNPLVLAQGSPPFAAVSVPASADWVAGIAYSHSNAFNEQRSPREYLLVDVETQVVDLWAGRRVARDMTLWVHAPLIRHSAGGLDGFIERYHATLGLPQGERVGFPRNQFQIRYERDGERLIHLEDETSGLGDVSLGISRAWAGSEAVPQVAVAASVKLPSGDASKLTGSGAVALGVQAQAGWRLWPEWQVLGRLGAQWLAEGDLLPHQQRPWVAFGAAGVEWQAASRLTLRAQLDLHAGLYDDTQLRLLREALTLTLGGTAQLGEHLALDVAVMEDAHVEAAPDVTLEVALRRSF